MNEEQVLEIINQQLDHALRGITVPAGFASAVQRQLPPRRLSWMPELLDSLGYVALLAAACVLIALFAPLDSPYWPWALAAATVAPAFWFGVRSLRAMTSA